MKAEIRITLNCKDAKAELECCLELPFAPTRGMRVSCFGMGGEVVESTWWHDTQSFDVKLEDWKPCMEWEIEATRLASTPGWKLRDLQWIGKGK